MTGQRKLSNNVPSTVTPLAIKRLRDAILIGLTHAAPKTHLMKLNTTSLCNHMMKIMTFKTRHALNAAGLLHFKEIITLLGATQTFKASSEHLNKRKKKTFSRALLLAKWL